MKLLLDQGLPRSAAPLVRQSGCEAVHVSELNMSHAEDAEILRTARELRSVVVTLDADFHTQLALSGERYPSVIRFRIDGLTGPEIVERLSELIVRFDEDLQQGSMVTVQPNRARVRRLPLLK